ncbi:uncharacterized protein Z519_08640 [Cladophialophora bantiana CBS 173.52]|uniref:Uncharacterized protein n=1 Tax=Cladophialophora bantiana (strain ATCC 10958 / CBS 173.52 / CDC B-1940 / NIH 8579) TaxID=1442370 RepID=A0A0D2FWF3_CLAB1|nr:uncharacterized protein Z519_08640 [Cladophialophora bantiana CBS 173.52]KIW90857.1 hypothetical protein Z519_08640 [Cladophialophora bantiana CBS 173.52]
MGASTLASALPLYEWVDLICATETTQDQKNWDWSSTERDTKTPLCDRLLSRGVLPARDAKRWANASEIEIAPPCKSCPRRRLHAAIGTLGQSMSCREDDPATPISGTDQQQDVSLSAIAETSKTPRAIIVGWLQHKRHSPALEKTQGKVSKELAKTHRLGDLPAAGTRQDLLLQLEHFRNILVSCSTTLAACSSEILDMTKHAAARDRAGAGPCDIA